ncbi:RluA family pseudouridine synthase [Butyrivibrio sp. LC3010]|uniref:RluA family pseudouridine synthase n=1 Tax=Butyrivibrio sp. LC3010 TaxID=1280680 RepID=UPI00040C2FA1|nr:RluA family pseudouridine synthase [Butyrivibrio sp. LC3010]
MKEIKVDNNSSGKRFDKFLGTYFSECSMGFIFKMLRKKNITLNGKKATGKEILQNGDTISVFFSDETFNKFVNVHIKSSETTEDKSLTEYEKAFKKLKSIEIIYEDDDILLINKPAGILSQKAEFKDISVNEWLIGYLLNTGFITPESLGVFKPSICNRLDRNTSGLLICSKSLPGARKSAEMLRERSVHKYYRTIVSGNVTSDEHISGYLIKDERKNTVKLYGDNDDFSGIDRNKLSRIETSYKVIGYKSFTINGKSQAFTELEVLLHTGKTHQIRAHLSSIGHPLIGDAKYGHQKVNEYFSKNYGLKFQLLHSYRLEFPSIEGELSGLSGKSFVAPLPDLYKNIANIC